MEEKEMGERWERDGGAKEGEVEGRGGEGERGGG